MSQESGPSSMDDQTRRSKRKASPASEKEQRKRTRMSKFPPRNTSEKNVNQGVKRKASEDGKDESASSSADSGRDSSRPFKEVWESKRKRKASTDGKESSKTKKTEFDIIDLTLSDNESVSSSADSGRDSTAPFKKVQVCNRKRKPSNDGGNPNGKRKRSAEIPETIQDMIVNARRDKFEAKYVQQNHLGEGGCGSVFAGYRKVDNLPVAIKHVPNDNVFCTHVVSEQHQLLLESVIFVIYDSTKPFIIVIIIFIFLRTITERRFQWKSLLC
ncbi:Serine/threonine-protein kinase pim-1 [Collichthys lucidus]|uniref:non-specific serine/threonine protein kinase n=1 Tax=Collichthys lucidus TaxID=240159 RepID=A0A4U5UQH4_COLLU|nr:Serine/threonine-protein kinase pim-1 [Collichthys lucidus]